MAEILFVVPTDELTVKREVNGTLLLATRLLQAGFDTRILRFGQIGNYGGEYGAFIGEITERILEEAPRCVSFYCLWPSYHIMLRIARELKARQPELTVVLGGPHASATAAATLEAMDFVDYICTGEGEDTVVPFFSALLRENGVGLAEVPGLYHRKDGQVCFCATENPLCDLDALPGWDDRLYRDLYASGDEQTRSEFYYMPLEVGRGCPYSCTFCCTSRFWRRTYRLRSPERIVGDMRSLNEKFGIRSFAFAHDAFTINHSLVTQVCDRILEEGLDIRWRCATRIDCVTEELVLKMKQAGMREIEVGIETGSPRMQKLVNKNLDLEKARKMIGFMLKNGIRVTLFFMHGFPEEREEDLAQTLGFALDMLEKGVSRTLFSLCTFIPATDITERFYDRLVYDPGMAMTHWGFYGDEEDLEMIRRHKRIFTMYYDLPTPLRRTYQYVWALNGLYRRFPKSMKQIRRLFGDDLRMYRELIRSNQALFDSGLAAVEKRAVEDSRELAVALAESFATDWVPRLRALMDYEWDVWQLRAATEDREICRTYGFAYADLKLGRPIESYLPGSTRIRLRRQDGGLSMQVLGMTLEDQ